MTSIAEIMDTIKSMVQEYIDLFFAFIDALGLPKLWNKKPEETTTAE